MHGKNALLLGKHVQAVAKTIIWLLTANRNTMPQLVYEEITGSKTGLKLSATRLRTYYSNIIKPLGYDCITIMTPEGPLKMHVEVVENAPISLLSGNSGERLKLLSVNEQYDRDEAKLSR